jgi:hypothetical protein
VVGRKLVVTKNKAGYFIRQYSHFLSVISVVHFTVDYTLKGALRPDSGIESMDKLRGAN